MFITIKLRKKCDNNLTIAWLVAQPKTKINISFFQCFKNIYVTHPETTDNSDTC